MLFGVLVTATTCGIAALERQPKPTVAQVASAAPSTSALTTVSPNASVSAQPSASASASVALPTLPPRPKFSPTGAPGKFAEELDVDAFQKGNIHTHTRWSDGDSPPEDVVKWYRDHGYNFLAITDHNGLTNPELFRPLQKKGFVLIPGEEITMSVEHKPVHENALCHGHTIGGGKRGSIREALTWGIAQVKAQRGTTLVNHPNFDWALTTNDILDAKGAELLEIWSGHPYVNTDGDATRPSHEMIWDTLLTAGIDFAGVAVDDAHHFKPNAQEPAARAGRGWVQVFAPKADKKLICKALADKRLYSSNGVVLKRITIKGDAMTLVLAESSGTSVELYGTGGALLDTLTPDASGAVTYKLRGGEGYVRARVTASDGKHAWTQAYRITSG